MHDFDVITGPTPVQQTSVCPVVPGTSAPRLPAAASRSQSRPRDEPASTDAATRAG